MKGLAQFVSESFNIIAPGCALVDHGPVHMTISAWSKGIPVDTPAVSGAKKAIELLKSLSGCLDTARQPIDRLSEIKLSGIPTVLQRMIGAVRQLNQGDITPMAAVAGTFSDLVKEEVLSAGADRVIVNNGGDIALCRGRGTHPFRIGIVADLSLGNVTHVAQVQNGKEFSDIEGVATSGYGGRSLTKGVASAVTCFAASSAYADAAATSVANAATCEHPEVKRCPAEKVDALTDIRGHLVVCSVGHLSQEAIQNAMTGAVTRARKLYAQGMIAGALIFVKNEIAIWPNTISSYIKAL